MSDLKLHDDIEDASDDAPGVLHAQVDLLGKVCWLEVLHTKDHVTARILHVVTGHITKIIFMIPKTVQLNIRPVIMLFKVCVLNEPKITTTFIQNKDDNIHKSEALKR